MNLSRVPNTVNQLFEDVVPSGTVQIAVDDQPVSGRYISIDDENLRHFGNCSYMGLESDRRLKEAAHEALDKFGVCFSMSRTFAHVPLVEELEESLRCIYGRPVVATTTTTLAHLSALPVFVAQGDIAIVDFMAHASVQMAAANLRGNGIQVETVRHNNMEALDRKIAAACGRTSGNIWYLADGVYSMFGDRLDVSALNELMERYPRLIAYIDDSHGAGWCGRGGSGSVFDEFTCKDRLFLTISLSKAYGAMGGAVVVPNDDIAKILRRTGANLNFSMPIPPAMLAAGAASAWLMQSEEMEDRRLILMGRIQRFIDGCREREIPLMDWSETPVFFIKAGGPAAGMELGRKLRERGIYTNPVTYPAVPMHAAGVRVTMTYHTTDEDIDALLEECGGILSAERENGRVRRGA